MTNKKYFVISDIHGFATELKQALWEAGFRKTNKEHILIVCGDIFDRGNENLDVYNFIHSIPKSRRILIKGNHEELFLDLLEKNYPEEHDFHNCTVDTFCEIAGSKWLNKLEHITMAQYFESSCHYSYGTYYDNVRIDKEAQHCWNEIKEKVKNHPITKWLKSKEWKDYYELDKYIFVHAFIPLNNEDGLPSYYIKNRNFSYIKDWRTKAHILDWSDARWGCPWRLYKQGLFKEEEDKGKVLVCGHWHTSDFFKYLCDDWSMSDTYDIFCGKGIIAIDGGVHTEYLDGNPYNYIFKHPQNVLIIDENYKAFEGKYKIPLSDMTPQPYKIIEDESLSKPDYRVSPTKDTYDITLCSANCETTCARKNTSSGIYTISDLSNICKSYKEKK